MSVPIANAPTVENWLAEVQEGWLLYIPDKMNGERTITSIGRDSGDIRLTTKGDSTPYSLAPIDFTCGTQAGR